MEPNPQLSFSGVNRVKFGDGLEVFWVLFRGDTGFGRSMVDALANFTNLLTVKLSWLGEPGSNWVHTWGIEALLTPLPFQVGEIGEDWNLGEAIERGEDTIMGEDAEDAEDYHVIEKGRVTRKTPPSLWRPFNH
jgi:hypothetical protein